eukprot:CAMPEP_0184644746 /NCGR_PEP_ID=MMETSP0308-20130426/1406_1 /TAXON_ID=38269 /ORGANISM="Gloeochaete witrockiana, Strain SAG 46.84" /LENGTH=1074 /DNA_ID=CAMNT_0027073437 /DNA_START=87 /DNA_END=3311 /DNA_ORIENTATION=+
MELLSRVSRPLFSLFSISTEEDNEITETTETSDSNHSEDQCSVSSEPCASAVSRSSEADIECKLCYEDASESLVFCTKSHAFCSKCVLALIRTGDSYTLRAGGVLCPFEENAKLIKPPSPPLPTTFESSLQMDNFEAMMGWYAQHRSQFDDSHIIPDNIITAFLNSDGAQDEAVSYQRTNVRQAFHGDYDSVMECPKCSSTCVLAPPAHGRSKVVSCPYCHHVFCLDCRDVYLIVGDFKTHRCLPRCQQKLRELHVDDSSTPETEDNARIALFASVVYGLLMGCDVLQCPHCLVHCERNEGCNHMTCGNCKRQFCWYCAQAWESCVCSQPLAEGVVLSDVFVTEDRRTAALNILHEGDQRPVGLEEHPVEDAAVALARRQLRLERMARELHGRREAEWLHSLFHCPEPHPIFKALTFPPSSSSTVTPLTSPSDPTPAPPPQVTNNTPTTATADQIAPASASGCDAMFLGLGAEELAGLLVTNGSNGMLGFIVRPGNQTGSVLVRWQDRSTSVSQWAPTKPEVSLLQPNVEWVPADQLAGCTVLPLRETGLLGKSLVLAEHMENDNGTATSTGNGSLLVAATNSDDVRFQWNAGHRKVLVIDPPGGFDHDGMRLPARAMLGRTVRRTRHEWVWRWGEQDGGMGTAGRVVKVEEDNRIGWLRVRWETGYENVYRWGAHGLYDLEVTLPLSATSDDFATAVPQFEHEGVLVTVKKVSTKGQETTIPGVTMGMKGENYVVVDTYAEERTVPAADVTARQPSVGDPVVLLCNDEWKGKRGFLLGIDGPTMFVKVSGLDTNINIINTNINNINNNNININIINNNTNNINNNNTNTNINNTNTNNNINNNTNTNIINNNNNTNNNTNTNTNHGPTEAVIPVHKRYCGCFGSIKKRKRRHLRVRNNAAGVNEEEDILFSLGALFVEEDQEEEDVLSSLAFMYNIQVDDNNDDNNENDILFSSLWFDILSSETPLYVEEDKVHHEDAVLSTPAPLYVENQAQVDNEDAAVLSSVAPLYEENQGQVHPEDGDVLSSLALLYVEGAVLSSVAPLFVENQVQNASVAPLYVEEQVQASADQAINR